MGAQLSLKTDSSANVEGAIKRAENRAGKHHISGRYHVLPRRLELDYDLSKKVLGTGYNGSVFKAVGKQDRRVYAVKGFHLHGISKDKMSELESEAEIFLSMDHPHVSRLVAVYECNKHLNLVMECMEGGELFERVLKQKRFKEEDAAHAVWQMLLAIKYLHGRGIVHRDLKLENFLYQTPDSDDLKLIDFGFSKVWEPNTKMALSCGTLSYVAPEVLGKSYTSQCDLWSLGVIVFILILGYMPFSGAEANQVDAIRAGKWNHRPEKFKNISSQAKDFIYSLLVVDPNKRLTAESALSHVWIKDHEIKRQEAKEQPDVDEGVINALCDFSKASQFRRACMSLMAWSLTHEERDEVSAAFKAMDTNQTGTITLEALQRVMRDKFDVSDEQVAPLFESLDTSGTQEIYYSEFLAAMVSTRIKLHDDLLAATFRRFDRDDTGFITVANLKEVLGESFDGNEVENLIKEADFVGDGQISYEEFLRYIKEGGATDKALEVAEKIVDHEDMMHHMKKRKTHETTVAVPEDEAATYATGKHHMHLPDPAELLGVEEDVIKNENSLMINAVPEPQKAPQPAPQPAETKPVAEQELTAVSPVPQPAPAQQKPETSKAAQPTATPEARQGSGSRTCVLL